MANYKIHVLTVDGSPRGVTPEEIENPGVGGAELALMTWAETMAKRGHLITIYNNARKPGNYNGVEYTFEYCFHDDDERDVLLLFRGPQSTLDRPKHTKTVIGWSCDQFTLGDYLKWYAFCDEMVLISQFHKKDHLARYGKVAENATVLDLGVRLWEYKELPKVENQVIYCSVPDRGLRELFDIWPAIRMKLPNLNLVVTSDYRLWGHPTPGNGMYQEMGRQLQGVDFRGKVSRSELVRLQCESEMQLYPCTYDENFCIANAECQVAGCFPLTSTVGALETTNRTGIKLIGSPESIEFKQAFVANVVDFFSQSFEARCAENALVRKKAQHEFDWDYICGEWEQLIETSINH